MINFNQCPALLSICQDICILQDELKELQSIPMDRLTYKMSKRYQHIQDEIMYLTEEARYEYQKIERYM